MRVSAANQALVLAVAERLVPSMNGAATERFAQVLEDWCLGALSPDDASWFEEAARQAVEAGAVEAWTARLQAFARQGVSLVTVCDPEYPSNLRMVGDRPPLLFVRGSVEAADDRAIAVVGTRKPSPEGAALAYRLAAELVERHVTVVSGLAEGIDTAAHRGALEAGGRTLAVFGTGIQHVYPSSNRGLADDIAASGACVSQFMPDMRGTRWSFPVRNGVTSALAVGTVVVEAGETSGARIQAEHALRHAKRLFLHRSLLAQPWAAATAGRAGVSVIDGVDEVVAAVDAELLPAPSLL